MFLVIQKIANVRKELCKEMTINLVEKYIDITRDMINSYMRLVMGSKFKKEYCDIFTEKYIGIRYYNYYEMNISDSMRTKVLNGFKKFEENLMIVNIEDREIIKAMCVFFYYVLYFDNVIRNSNLDSVTNKLSRLMKRTLNREVDGFPEALKKIIDETNEQRKKLLNLTENNKFYLNIKRYPNLMNTFRVSIRYNLKFPEEFSEIGIENVFNDGLVNEDKLYLEYYFVSKEVLQDIINCNFKKHYIIEFATSILEKKTKQNGLLKIIDSQAIKDKISLKITHEDYLKYKEHIEDLIRGGFHFTIILDDTFNAEYKEITTLRIFQYVIVDDEAKIYEKIKDYKKQISNLIEI